MAKIKINDPAPVPRWVYEQLIQDRDFVQYKLKRKDREIEELRSQVERLQEKLSIAH